MRAWTESELKSFAPADDLHVSPYREDGVTYGTPTFIWSVLAVDDAYRDKYAGSPYLAPMIAEGRAPRSCA